MPRGSWRGSLAPGIGRPEPPSVPPQMRGEGRNVRRSQGRPHPGLPSSDRRRWRAFAPSGVPGSRQRDSGPFDAPGGLRSVVVAQFDDQKGHAHAEGAHHEEAVESVFDRRAVTYPDRWAVMLDWRTALASNELIATPTRSLVIERGKSRLRKTTTIRKTSGTSRFRMPAPHRWFSRLDFPRKMRTNWPRPSGWAGLHRVS